MFIMSWLVIFTSLFVFKYFYSASAVSLCKMKEVDTVNSQSIFSQAREEY